MSRRVADRFRTALVTGAADGLGRAFADMLLAEGVEVWGTSRRIERLSSWVQAGGGRAHALALDLADGAGVQAAFEGARGQAGGRIDLLINNAGYGLFGEFGAVDAEEWRAQLDAMLGGTLRLTHAAWKSWGAGKGGCVVNISSLAAEFPLPFLSGYNVAKAGLSALSESLSYEGRSLGVTVIDFRPGDYRTGFNRAIRGPGPGAAGPTAAVWRVLETNLGRAPLPSRAAADLRRALLRGRGGIVRSGGWFQARIAPFAARFLPSAWLRRISSRYFGLR